MQGSSKNKLIVICGPTAVGKTTLAIQLAKYYNTEIISADSRQFYKELNIGTAKPSVEELNMAKHHFINNLNINDAYSSGIFEKEVLQFLKEWFGKSTVPIIMAGGSGLFIKAVCEGFDALPKVDEKVRINLTNIYLNEGITVLQEKLKAEDITYFNVVDKNNPQRLIRALELIETTGAPFSSLLNKRPKPRFFDCINIGLNIDRDLLYDRINNRVDIMMENGLLDEVEKLYKYKNLKALQTVGYTELIKYLDGNISKEEAIALIKQNTRRYAKRQITWFKKVKDIKWFEPKEINSIKAYIDTYLG